MLITQLIIVFSCALGIGIFVPAQLKAFLAGAFLSTLNFGLLAKLWEGVLAKKPVATSLIIIVTKYAILGGLLYVFVREWKLPLIPLLVGLSTLGASLLVVALQNLKKI